MTSSLPWPKKGMRGSEAGIFCDNDAEGSVRHFPCAGEQPVAQNHSKLLRLKRPLNRRLGIFPHG